MKNNNPSTHATNIYSYCHRSVLVTFRKNKYFTLLLSAYFTRKLILPKRKKEKKEKKGKN